MIVLDTNVVSELMKSAPDTAVMGWIDAIPGATVFVSAVTQAEILYGVALVPEGKRRDGLTRAARTAFETYFRGRILPFDSEAAEAFATLAAGRRQAGRPISQADAQIAAIARSRGAALATRNVPDFEGCGVEVINPWNAAGP
jgi:predicted nucleic acid-binding protein